MILQKHKAYKYKNKIHYKYTIIIPGSVIKNLGWKEGQELKNDVKNNNLVLRASTEEEKKH